jgi:hypothetical protein
VDAGKGPEISCVSSVSGGSLTNGFVGLKTDLYVAASGDFRTDVAPLAAAVSTRGTLWSAPLTYAYAALAAAILVVATVLCFPLEGPGPFVTWAVAIVLVGWLARRRGWVAARAFDRSLFHGAELSRLNPNTDHVICACDLQTPETVDFSGRFVYSYRLGWGVPGDLPLTRAVQASACPPGSFAPIVLPLERHLFPLAGAGEDPITYMLLTDGAVYDGMAAEWPLRLGIRVREGGTPDPPPREVDEVVVVNGSGVTGRMRRRSLGKRLGEIPSLLTANDVLYDQATNLHHRLLDARFRATRAGVADPAVRLAGGTVQIDQSPYAVPRLFARGDGEPAARARAALDLLTPGGEPGWKDDVEANRSVKGTFGRIPADRAARLLRHAYVLTMVNMHVLSDYPLLPVPSVADFEKLVV